MRVGGGSNAVRAKGGDVAVSFGGYNGAELGASCNGASGLAAAYQSMISKYNLTRIDLDYEGDDLDANTAVGFGAIKILEDNARAAGAAAARLPDGTDDHRRFPGIRYGRDQGGYRGRGDI